MMPTRRRDLFLFSLAVLALCIGLCARSALPQPLPRISPEDALGEYLGTLEDAHAALMATPMTRCRTATWDGPNMSAFDCSISTVGEMDPEATVWHGVGTTREGIDWYLEDMERIRALDSLGGTPDYECREGTASTLSCSGWNGEKWTACQGTSCEPVAVPEGRVTTLVMFGLIGLGFLARARI